MKIKEFVFHFIDHENKTCWTLCFKILHDKVVEWNHDEDDLEKIIAWKTKHIIWEHKLWKQVERMIQEKLFSGKSSKFGDFVLVKCCMMNKANLFNMNVEKGTKDIRFRAVMGKENHLVKYKRGEAPKNWVEVFDYDAKNYLFEFICVGSEHDHDIRLIEKASFEIPREKSPMLETNQMTNFNKNPMFGGNYNDDEYEQKYHKYKFKYNQSKKNRMI